MTTTITRFRILPPLYQLNGATIIAPTRGGDVKLRFKITSSGQSQMQFHGHVIVEGDDLGALHNTIVEVEFPALLSIRPRIRGNQPSEPPALQRHAVELLNVCIGHYRRAATSPQIRSVALKHASGFHYLAIDDAGRRSEGDFFQGMGLRTDGEDAGLKAGDPAVIDDVQEGVRSGPIPTHLSLYLDSLAERSSGNYRSALAHLFMSVEMLSSMTCWALGAKVAGIEEVAAFLDPPGDDRPSIHKVVKQTRRWAASGPSVKELKSQLSKTWKHRNDIMHGNPVTISQADLETVYSSAAPLMEWLNSVLRASNQASSPSSEP